MRPALALIALACCATLAACGGSSAGDTKPRTVATAPAPHTPLDLPAGVPLNGSGVADPAGEKVIRAWADALRHGHVRAASALWAVPAAIQNGTPVLKLTSARDVRIFNSALPCGAIVARAEKGAGGFTVVTFRLTDRPGGDCGSGVKGRARTAIRVKDGKIAEWYRLPDPGGAPQPDVAPGPANPV